MMVCIFSSAPLWGLETAHGVSQTEHWEVHEPHGRCFLNQGFTLKAPTPCEVKGYLVRPHTYTHTHTQHTHTHTHTHELAPSPPFASLISGSARLQATAQPTITLDLGTSLLGIASPIAPVAVDMAYLRHEVSAAGCADGSREGFNNTGRFPSIAACDGGWTVPGIAGAAGKLPACNRAAGGHGIFQGCSAADLCAVGWHVCTGAADIRASVNHDAAGCDLASRVGEDTNTMRKVFICFSTNRAEMRPPAARA